MDRCGSGRGCVWRFYGWNCRKSGLGFVYSTQKCGLVGILSERVLTKSEFCGKIKTQICSIYGDAVNGGNIMDNNERISLTKPSGVPAGNTQGWRDPATGEIYPNQPVQQAAPQMNNAVLQPMNGVQQGYPQQNVPYPQPVQGYPQPYQQDANLQINQPQYQSVQQPINGPTKFCKHCGQVIPEDAVICTHCGRQVEELRSAANTAQPIIINNNNNNIAASVATGAPAGRIRNKWVALLLCFFFGWLGIHRFYEGKIGTGLLYMFTFGLCFIGSFIDFIILLCKPDPYYV